jgi:hypothetical protein
LSCRATEEIDEIEMSERESEGESEEGSGECV